VIEPVLDLPPRVRRSLVAVLETGRLRPPFTARGLRASIGYAGDLDAVATTLAHLDGLGLNPRAIAAWLTTVDAALDREPVADLVWSGPEVPGVPARDTRRVFDELVQSAGQSIWVSTYAFFDGPKAFERLARRMDHVPGLDVRLLLNIERKRSDTSTPTDLVRRFADKFWDDEWPGTRRPMVYYDPRAIEPDGTRGVLHAKAMVVDERRAFITSANLTEAAFDRNIEAGLLVRDRMIAVGVVRQFRGLIERGDLKPLPA
jgi:phosphatidylserine/phosphatidylglycerophosphate/cardiolipin synthase-like enzyme